MTVTVSEGLREIHLGGAQGMTRGEIEQKYGVDFSQRMRTQPLNDEDVARLGSETSERVVQRALYAIEAHLESRSVERIAVCSHGGVVRRLVQQALPEGDFPPPIVNGVVYPFHFDRQEKRLILLDHLFWDRN